MPVMLGRVRSGWVRGGLLILALLILPEVAQAHGRLKSSSPGAGAHLGVLPREIRLEFTEVPDLTFTRVTLLGPSGVPVPLAPLAYTAASRRTLVATIAVTLSSGRYTVRWQLAGDDGHPVRGQFEFSVAPGAMADTATVQPTVPTSGIETGGTAMHHDPASMPDGTGFGVESPAYVALRWMQFVALFLAIGAVAFRQLVLGVMRRWPDVALEFVHEAESRAARIGLRATLVLVATLGGRLVAQSYAMHGPARAWSPQLSMEMISKTVWGQGWLLQFGGVMLSALGFYLARRVGTRRTFPSSKGSAIAWPLATVGVVLLALSSALSGHAAAVPTFRGLAILADTLHVLGASSWLGSLTLVLLAGLPAARDLETPVRGPGIARLVNAFSLVALVSAGVATVTGVTAAWLHLGRIPELWGTRYGVTLLVKLATLSIVALTGYYNWRFVQPQLGTDGATARLRYSATIEVGVAVLVLLVTAVLVATPTALDMKM